MHEVQNDARVMKAVVDEVDVCHWLGMAVSDEGNRALMHKFEFGMLNPCKYDADFARVYSIEREGEHDGRRQFVAFAWLSTSLFERHHSHHTGIRHLLLSLSSSITCCLSRKDFRRVQSEVHAASNATTMQWSSCSVALRVQRQEEQSESVRCLSPVKSLVPRRDPIRNVAFIGGVSAIAVENAKPTTTELGHIHDVVGVVY
ncbi:hypothetical protein GN244_ATG04084 [Phytophthora infestans]|uniref:Uncharacterized protein n=1 Tax=Phytophthora infestans TaxID=4787 RepID=A0A833TCK0_PHYIN|nr:hypothetical protein GN244_ATG04084 [Phytophthora infestans]